MKTFHVKQQWIQTNLFEKPIKTIWKQSMWNEGIYYIQDEIGYEKEYIKPGKTKGIKRWIIKCLHTSQTTDIPM